MLDKCRTFGWLKTKNGFTIPKQVMNSLNSWKLKDTAGKSIHLSLINDPTSLCGGYDTNEVEIIEIDNLTASDKKLFCKNCARVAMGLNPEDINNNTVKQALKTVSKKKTSKGNRLDNYSKILRKSKDEMQADMEKVVNKSNIKLPDEISQDRESLVEVITSSLPILSIIRKTAILNLDRTVGEFKKADPDSNDYEIVRETHNIKSLVKAIDQIKQFIKQL